MGILRADRITGLGGANAIKGSVDPSGGAQNTMDFWTYESLGNAVDFGDRTVAGSYVSACSNGHGGL